MNGVMRPRSNVDVNALSLYYAIVSSIFVTLCAFIYKPISDMMISSFRKQIGLFICTISILFFAILSFKVSKSKVFILPLLPFFVLLSIPFILNLQESRHGFNYVHSEKDATSLCNDVIQGSFPHIQHSKYVVFEPTNTGTGNRLLGLTSTYFLSKILGRQMLVDWKTTIVFGATLQSLFESDKILPLSDVIGIRSLTAKETDYMDLTYCRHCVIRRKKRDFKRLLAPDFFSQFTKPFLIVKSNTYFVPNLIANRAVRPAICGEYGSACLFHRLFNETFTLNRELQTKLSYILNETQGKPIIGIQIRRRDRISFPEDRVQHFFMCALNLAKKYEDPIFFIASDSEEVKEFARFFFKEKLISLKEKTREFGQKGIEAAVLDMMILSKCRELILTPFSTFGAVAAGIGGVIPHYISRSEGYCIKDVTYEPKSHYWHAMESLGAQNYSYSESVNHDDSFM